MATEFNRHQTPNGGWKFYEPSTGWKEPTPLGSTFGQVVDHIIAMRKKNPAITAKHNLATAREAVEAELETYTRKRLGIGGPAPAPFRVSPSQRPGSGAVAAAIERIKKLASGAGFLLEWEQSGLPPVAKETAEARAVVCAVCPKNQKNANLSDFFTVPAAELIRKHLQRLTELKLETSKDGELHVCSACLCPLRLKAWAPAELIVKRIKPEEKEQLDPGCWILNL